MKKADLITSNHIDFLYYLKSKFPLYHKSNVFFRDLQYGVIHYLQDKKKVKITYSEAEKICHEVTAFLEKKDILKKLDHQTWLLNYPDFAKKAS